MFNLNRASNPARQPKIDNTGGVNIGASPWADTTVKGQSLVNGQAVNDKSVSKAAWGDTSHRDSYIESKW